MPRLPRTDYEGAWHHVMNRGAGRVMIFRGEDDCSLFLGALAESSRRYAVEIHAYCLLTNHFHLLVRSLDGRLSDFMRFVSGRFTRMKNLRDGTEGPLFRGRFTSRLIEQETHLLECIRYIHLNPVRAGLVANADDWVWSSARAYLGVDRPADWLLTRELLGMFGPGDQARGYRIFQQDGLELDHGVRPGGSDTG
jgi:REP element-mobilizing transposase RayT